MPATTFAIQDKNQFPGPMLHTGTAGTADLVRATGQSSGAANVYVLGGYGGLIEDYYDYISYSEPTGTTEVFVYSNNGTVIGTVTVAYTDTTKGTLNFVSKTP